MGRPGRTIYVVSRPKSGLQTLQDRRGTPSLWPPGRLPRSIAPRQPVEAPLISVVAVAVVAIVVVVSVTTAAIIAMPHRWGSRRSGAAHRADHPGEGAGSGGVLRSESDPEEGNRLNRELGVRSSPGFQSSVLSR